MKKIFLEKSTRAPSQRLPEVKTDLNEFLHASKKLKFVWFGHSTLMLNLDSKIILIDPVFSDYAFSLDIFVKRFQKPVLDLHELPRIDTILISHDHYDHLDKKTIDFYKDKSNDFIVPTGVGAILENWGIKSSRITELDWAETTLKNGIQFTATPAQHFSGRGAFDRNKTLWSSWVIKGQSEKIFYSGDTGYGNHFKEIGDTYGPFDITFIENGQYNELWKDIHMLPEETVQAHLDVNGKVFVPVHWGMFDLSLHKWNEPVERTHQIATSWDIPMIVPKLGEIVELDSSRTQSIWWRENPEETFSSATYGISTDEKVSLRSID